MEVCKNLYKLKWDEGIEAVDKKNIRKNNYGSANISHELVKLRRKNRLQYVLMTSKT